jgi:hypothetical protein
VVLCGPFRAGQFADRVLADNADGDEPAWVVEHAKKQKRQAILQKRKDLEARLAKIRAHEKRQQELYKNGDPRFKKLVGHRRENISCLRSDSSRKQTVMRKPQLVVKHNFFLMNTRAMKSTHWGIRFRSKVYQLQPRNSWRSQLFSQCPSTLLT